MEQNIVDIKILNKSEVFEKIINQRNSINYEKFLKIFKEKIEKEKWIEISNKEMYFNKDIMACFSKENIFYNIEEKKSIKQCQQEITNEERFKKLELKFDIPSENEINKSFFEKNNLNPKVYNVDYVSYKKNNNILYKYLGKKENIDINFSFNSGSKELDTLINDFTGSIFTGLLKTIDHVVKPIYLFPIYRLGKEEDYNKFEKGEKVFPYSNSKILKIFLKEEFIPKFIFENKVLYKEYEELIKEFKIKVLENGKYLLKINGSNIQLNEKKIIEDFFEKKNLESIFENISLEFILENGDIIEKSYRNGILNGNAINYKASGNIDIIEYQYKNGIIEGKGIIRYRNGDKEEVEYINEKLQGKSIYTYKNGNKEERNYDSGILNGKSILKYSNGDEEKREYKNGILQGEAIYIYSDGAKEIRNYIDGKIKGKIIYEKGKEKRMYEYKENKKIEITSLYNLLNIDKIRVNLDTYDENILLDPNRGHWDLVENERKDLEEKLGKKIYMRNPSSDIKTGGIVGIDFGTKSTVVVFQDDNTKTLPMRISGVTFNKDIEENDYENPTVIEFKDIESFINDYKKKKGRPFTKWGDVTVSHTAYQSLLTGTNEQFSSVLSELKQWAGSKNKKIILKDKKGVERLIPPYLQLLEDDIDPIELYAYYIGSYINNMRNGIYLEYYLSFPVNYEMEIRNKILKSFEKGIKKSLPESILNDEKQINRFKFNLGTSEPAAYSVCALQEYGFEPEGEEKIYYGVFDFGGGTTDFDFGIWKISEDEESYDYDLEHFGAGGDKYLGGENILKELAYEIFKKNQKLLREKNISFVKPEWCDRFIGDELLIDFSQEANLNLRQLAEKLRGIWENSEEKLDEDSLKINLYNRSGKLELGINLNIDIENLKIIIEEKIEKGVKNFFNSMEKAFRNEEVNNLNILLAGNSCKHPYVKKAFENEITKRQISAEIYPPLGTKEAIEKLKEKGIIIDIQDKSRPTGKTGVAYGILDTILEGRINIIDKDREELNNKDIKFKYYVGDERRKKLKCFLTPQTTFRSFIYLTTLKSSAFNIYYTISPEAMDDNLVIEKAKRKRILLEKEHEKGSKIYIRIISPSKIEYVVTIKDILEKEFLENGIIDLD